MGGCLRREREGLTASARPKRLRAAQYIRMTSSRVTRALKLGTCFSMFSRPFISCRSTRARAQAISSPACLHAEMACKVEAPVVTTSSTTAHAVSGFHLPSIGAIIPWSLLVFLTMNDWMGRPLSHEVQAVAFAMGRPPG